MRPFAFAAVFLATLPALANEGRREHTVEGGCLVWNVRPHDGASATWSGGCDGGKISGQGTYTWADGDSYAGGWPNGPGRRSPAGKADRGFR